MRAARLLSWFCAHAQPFPLAHWGPGKDFRYWWSTFHLGIICSTLWPTTLWLTLWPSSQHTCMHTPVFYGFPLCMSVCIVLYLYFLCINMYAYLHISACFKLCYDWLFSQRPWQPSANVCIYVRFCICIYPRFESNGRALLLRRFKNGPDGAVLLYSFSWRSGLLEFWIQSMFEALRWLSPLNSPCKLALSVLMWSLTLPI